MGRRGPKLKEGVREGSGRLQRSGRTRRILDGLEKEERDTLSVGLEARQRLYGVKAENSRDAMIGSYIGRLCRSGEITRVQYEAAMAWIADSENYSRAVNSPRQPGAIDLNATKGLSAEAENVGRVRNWRQRYEAACRAIQDAQIALRGTATLFAALDHVVIRDLELVHMVPDARLALNALARHYRIEPGRVA